MLAGSLPEQRFESIVEHVDGCSTCQESIQQMGESTPVLSVEDGDAASPSFSDEGHCQQVLQQIEAMADAVETVNNAADASIPVTSGSTGPPPEIAGYETGPLLGQGGMGAVYQARDVRLNRLVAIKVINQQSTSEHLKRFQTEAEAVARLQHPHIVQVFALGEYEGHPYLALELVDGHSLAELLQGTPLEPKQAARLCATLAEAVDYAHQQGIVHRDLKPGNILMAGSPQSQTQDEGAPPEIADLVPKIADFGLARQMEDDQERTRDGTILGTVKYMSPEQAEGRVRDVGPSSDMYSLGAILYELLTGHVPLVGNSTLETLKLVSSTEPVAPAKLLPSLSADLSTICMKCLEKNPARRYSSAGALADDLHRFLAGEPILARPVSETERAIKWARRHPAIAGLLMTVALVTMVGIGGVLWQYGQAVTARKQAEANAETAQQREVEANRRKGEAETARNLAMQAEAKATTEADRAKAAEARIRIEAEATRRQFYFNRIALAEQHRQNRNLAEARRILAECPFDLRHIEWEVLNDRCRDTSVQLQPEGNVSDLAITDDGSLLAMGLEDGRIQFHRPGMVVRSGERPSDRPDSGAANDRTTDFQSVGQEESTDWKSVLQAHDGAIVDMDFDESGNLLISVGLDNVVKVWDLSDGGQKLVFARRITPPEKDLARFLACRISNDGKRIGFTSGPTEAVILELNGGEGLELAVLDAGPEAAPVTDIAFSPDGQTIATAGKYGRAILWNLSSQKKLHLLAFGRRNAGSNRVRLAFSDDGNSLVTCSENVDVWNVKDGTRQRRFQPNAGTVLTELFLSADNSRYATRNWRNVLRVADFKTGAAVLHLDGEFFALSRDGRTIVSKSSRGIVVHVLDHEDAGEMVSGNITHFDLQRKLLARVTETAVEVVANGEIVETIHHPRNLPPREAVISGDANVVAISYGEGVGALAIWNRSEQRFTVEIPRNTFRYQGAWQLELNTDGSRLLGKTSERSWLVELDQSPPVCEDEAGFKMQAVSRDGTRVAMATNRGENQIRDAQTGSVLSNFENTGRTPNVLRFNRDGSLLAGGDAGANAKVYLWDCRSGRLLNEFAGHYSDVSDLVFSPDSRRIISIGHDETMRFWDVESGQPIVAMTTQSPAPRRIDFAAGGLAIATQNGHGLYFQGDRRHVVPAGKTIDLLATIQPDRDALHGAWSFNEEGHLVCNPVPGSQIRIPVAPTGDYRVSLRFVRQTGTDSVCVFLPILHRATVFMVDSHANRGGYTGLQYVDRLMAYDQENIHHGLLLENGTEHQLEIAVSQEPKSPSITAWLDGRKIYHWADDVNRLHLHHFDAGVGRDRSELGINTWKTGVEFREARLDVLSGTAKSPIAPPAN